jgi:hypothetical protein
MVKLLTKTNAIIAGGSITSLFSQSEINDFDVYFRSKEDMIVFIRNAYKQPGSASNFEDLFILSENQIVKFDGTFNITCQNQTARSITFTQNSNTIQLIHFAYFETPNDIFDSYDFHCNMAAYDFSTGDFVLHEKFMEDVAARRLTFNEGTRYPIMSTLRIHKYIERGYTINRKELFKIGLTCSMLNLNSWESLIDQLSGFYGVSISDMFDQTQDFSMNLAIEMLDNVYELPETDLVVPSFEQIMFLIAGNPYAEYKYAYRLLSINREDGKIVNYYDTVTKTEFPVDGSVVNITEPISIEYDARPTRQWGFGSDTVYVLIQMIDTTITRGIVGYKLTGTVQIIGKY